VWSHSRSFLLTVAQAITLLAAVLISPSSPLAANETACTGIAVCYCIQSNLMEIIAKDVGVLRRVIAEQRSQGKAIGYMSVPLSSAGGGYFPLNALVAKHTKDRIEKRFGAHSVWVLNPAAPVDGMPTSPDRAFVELNQFHATGRDYMYMWTQVLEGERGTGEDFDFVYFVGPSDFAREFELTGEGDMEKIDAYFDRQLAIDPAMQKAVGDHKLSKTDFRNYYALRASVSFSYGSHDEWNIVRVLNDRRRGDSALGIAKQLPILFDGRALPAGSYEEPVASGDAGSCVN
jgi:hypothetical protein